ncbi:MAG: penicillin-binding protein 1A [Myxococcota bacterium]|jgi:penicillin-binding protein 1A
MPIKLTCPRCGTPLPLSEPLPQPGDEVHCGSCGAGIAVTYPEGVVQRLKARGKVFAGSEATEVVRRRVPAAPLPSSPRFTPEPMPAPAPAPSPSGPSPTSARTEAYEFANRASTSAPTEAHSGADEAQETPTPPTVSRTKRGSPAAATAATIRPPPKEAEVPMAASSGGKQGRVGGVLGCLGGSMVMTLAGGIIATALLGAGTAAGGYWYYSQDLPTVEALRGYEPPTVTVVRDRNGVILGEIFDQRRYVVPLDEIPKHVQFAFLAAEDANFWNHGGVDYLGITRAMISNLQQGRMAQGASTITQQVARNFLLTRDKKLERKIKEIILSWRVEESYTKEHILYLYLNEIFLGSHAYGVEAASQAYFGKSVRDATIAEAAILAGLPQRPSDYSPHRHWEKARARQEYVLRQMVDKGYITESERTDALAEDVTIVQRTNTFLEQAPHFTEYVRRALVDRYGEETVLNGGLDVTTTCDLDLQRVAQEAVSKGVHSVDQRMGFRREGVETLGSDDAITARRAEHEADLKKAWALARDAAGRVEAPETSVLTAGEVYAAVVLEVQPKWARVAIGAHEGIVPLEWSKWVYDPNVRKSWRHRTATDLTARVDTDDDRKPDTPILRRGDLVTAKLMALSSKDEDVAKAFKGTPGESSAMPALHLWQDPEVESALLSMDVESGAVRAMIGGADFRESQFNRAIQSRRQVGSTFKPIVYGAAVETKKITTGSIVADAPLAFATSEEFVWKPSNYSHNYEGNLTLRQALAASKNTCTVRVLETIDPGMNDDVVYNFARRLGIGGAPLHELADDWVPSPENDVLCPWVREQRDSTICMDHFPPRDDSESNTGHRTKLSPDDVHMCRACDMSMGLGSASLTMEELVRAYSAFASGGELVEPYYIEEVKDRHGKVLESHERTPPVRIMEPEVASITSWLLQSVVQGGTGYQARAQLGLDGLGGKTGTTNDEKDTWFIGFTNDVITAAWVGYDQPRSLGVSSTGGRTALPIWIDYMRVAAPKERDRPLPMRGDIEWAQIEESTGRRVTSGGVGYPFIRGTAPEGTGIRAGQVSLQELTTEL